MCLEKVESILYSVMLVDDEEIVRIELRRLIDWNALGFNIIIEAKNGSDAILRLDRKSVDLVITDIKMPKVDGVELLRHLKENNLCSCVIFLSGYRDFKFAQQGLILGAFDYILKPVDPEILDSVLKRVKIHFEEVNQANNDVNFYYLNEKEILLNTFISQCDEKAFVIADELFNEIHNILKEDLNRIALILNHMIENIVKDLSEKNIVLKSIIDYEAITKTELLNIYNLDEMKSSFMSKIFEIVSIVNKLKLNQKNNIINKVCEYVIQNIDRELTLKTISDKFFISKNYLSFLFKQETGENFLDYLTKIKMERAKFLLKEANYKAYEVSNILGYSETTYFSRLFKKHTGFTPTEYRKHV